jgi:hypothetical protein
MRLKQVVKELHVEFIVFDDQDAFGGWPNGNPVLARIPRMKLRYRGHLRQLWAKIQ